VTIPGQPQDSEKPAPQQAGDGQLTQAGAARRRFTRAGVAASGVLLTLHSQPGMACDICTTPSGFLSGGLQSFRGPQPTCLGRSPSYWQGASWPSGCNKSAKFSTIFPCSGNYSKSSSYGGCTLATIVAQPCRSFDSQGIGSALVACWLNVKSSKSTFQTLAMLQTIWSEYQSQGYYTPTAGVHWDVTKIVSYLQGTYY
jgi:hypothetical protein